jgi:hypothetical protein
MRKIKNEEEKQKSLKKLMRISGNALLCVQFSVASSLDFFCFSALCFPFFILL